MKFLLYRFSGMAMLLLVFQSSGQSTAETGEQGDPIKQPVYATIDEAIARGDLSDVRRHVEAHPESAEQGKHPKLSPLHQAILRKREEIALFLIQSGADVNRIDTSKRTPLHLAVERDLPVVAAALLSSGADPDRLDNAGWAPLHHAAAKDQLEMTRVLLKGGANPAVRSERGGIPLHEAAASAGTELVELLLLTGVSPASVSDDGRTPLQIAREFGNEAAITILEKLP